jgi:hypothetical protein
MSTLLKISHELRPRAMNNEFLRNSEELTLIERRNGRLVYEMAPTTACIQISEIPLGAPQEANRYLWVLVPGDLPHALEVCEYGKSLCSGQIKHSNLTGGDDAIAGGELWFIARDRVIVNFKSGRYGLTIDDQDVAQRIVNALVADSYAVALMGWDEESGFPHSHLISPPEFTEPDQAKK